MQNVRVLILDFDGVLCDSEEFHSRMFREFSGISVSEEEFASMHDGNFFAHVVSKLRHIDWMAYRDFVLPRSQHLAMQEGCRSFLEAIGSLFALFVVTSNGEANVAAFLNRNGVGSFFCEILGLETSLGKVEKLRGILSRHNVAPDEVVFVTDTLGDILEANEVGIRTIAVDFGFHDRERLARGNPYRIVSSFGEILELLGV